MTKFIGELADSRLIAILRGLSREQADRTVDALASGGIRFVEVTANTDDWQEMIRNWRDRYGDRLFVGAGTVIDAETAREAHAAGAQFLVTPNTDARVIELALARDLPVISGAFTPTEIVTAWKAGATAVKLFPMQTFGLSYFREIRAPLDRIRLVPTGGIRPDNARSYLDAGAFALGLGSSLVDKELIRQGLYGELTRRAEKLVRIVSGQGE